MGERFGKVNWGVGKRCRGEGKCWGRCGKVG